MRAEPERQLLTTGVIQWTETMLGGAKIPVVLKSDRKAMQKPPERAQIEKC